LCSIQGIEVVLKTRRNFFLQNYRNRNRLEDTAVAVRIILKYFKKWDVRRWTGLMWLWREGHVTG
jgi:hypothetical protein